MNKINEQTHVYAVKYHKVVSLGQNIFQRPHESLQQRAPD